jgi:error-prone DNA polymerase
VDGYAPLWCKSNFSFLEGASHPEELVEEAHRVGLRSIAITDRDGVYGMVRAHVKARELGMHVICGAQLTVAPFGQALASSPLHRDDDAHGRGPGWGVETDALPPAIPVTGRRGRTKRAESRQHFGRLRSAPPAGRGLDLAAPPAPSSRIIVLATDRAGWANLVRLVTAGRRRCDKGESLVEWTEVCRHSGGLVGLWADALDRESDPPAALIADMKSAYGDRLYALLARHREADDVPREARLRARAKAAQLPLVAATEVLYHARGRRPLQDVLTCIRHGVTLATAGRLIKPNDEHDLRAPYPFSRLFTDERAAVARTLDIAARCTFELGALRYRYPSERLPDGSTSGDYLRRLVSEGAANRYGDAVPAKVRAQLDMELSVIEDLDYPGYFLTMYEIVSYCRRRDILCQGRGSAANSAVCFCLGITAVDPVKHHTLFERFLSRERAEPPDIDLDIEHERREEVIQHVYTVYGRDHAAMVCNIVRYRPRSAVRDVGKVLGIPETALDRAAKYLSIYGSVEADALARAGLAEGGKANALEHLSRLADELQEFPRHLSVHPGGFLLGHEPVHDIVPIENAAMPGRTVIQWDKDDLEDLGLFKVDLLALGALHQLHLAFDMIRAQRGVELSMATIPADDSDTYDMICTADTIGTFQIESRAQMSMLPRLKPRVFHDLVVQVSIVRPGPISGGMVHPYLKRRAGLEPIEYPHECLKPVLERTMGVPLFQEQVMELAVVAADYTPGEADQLRRDMAAWRRSGRIEKHRERLIGAMAAKGIAREFGERVFEQIRGFGEYGFPECVAGDTRVIDADTGAWVAIEDVVDGRVGLKSTLTCSDELRLEKRRVVAAKASGRKRVFTLRTALGHEIVATASHPFRTLGGWTPLGELSVGDAVAVARGHERKGQLGFRQIQYPSKHKKGYRRWVIGKLAKLLKSRELERLATSEVYWDRIVSIEPAGERETYDLSIDGNHNFLANNFVVHNSHATSFALIAYATSYLRRHFPAEFTCSLLNAQPMGFYSAATIVGDAQRHGVEVQPIDVNASDWDCTLESRAPRPEEQQAEDAKARAQVPALRMGLRWVKGIQLADGNRIVEHRPYVSIEDFVRRARISPRMHSALAEAGALGGLTAQRRDALWQVAGWVRRQDESLALGGDVHGGAQFGKLGKLDEINWDYTSSDHSTRGHPLGPLRGELRSRGWPDARTVAKLRDGQRVDYVGIVICRQQPGTASGVVFMTLEDETGFVNLVVWQRVFEEYARVIRTASLIGVTGKLQIQEGVVHVIAERVWHPELTRHIADVDSRDFH